MKQKLIERKAKIFQLMREEVKTIGIKGILEKYNDRYTHLRNQISIINKIENHETINSKSV